MSLNQIRKCKLDFFSDGMGERKWEGKQRDVKERSREGHGGEWRDQSIVHSKGKYCLMKLVYQLYVW